MCAATFKEFLLFSFLFFFKTVSQWHSTNYNVVVCNLTTFLLRVLSQLHLALLQVQTKVAQQKSATKVWCVISLTGRFSRQETTSSRRLAV